MSMLERWREFRRTQREALRASNHPHEGRTSPVPVDVVDDLLRETDTPPATPHEELAPDPQHVIAEEVKAAAEEAATNGVGAFVVDGQMIDEPFLVSARAIVALAEQFDPARRGEGR